LLSLASLRSPSTSTQLAIFRAFEEFNIIVGRIDNMITAFPCTNHRLKDKEERKKKEDNEKKKKNK
tara:strand:- start:2412 stop:2609 length:198 start_codon:yes stop_codon:yes gene_type:complete